MLLPEHLPPLAASPAPAESPHELPQLIAAVWREHGDKRPWPLMQELVKAEFARFALAQPYQSLEQLAEQIGISKTTLIEWKKTYG
jgi:hypothetical protein